MNEAYAKTGIREVGALGIIRLETAKDLVEIARALAARDVAVGDHYLRSPAGRLRKP